MSYTPPEFHLEHLLRRCFDVQELHRLLTYLPDQRDLKDHLPVVAGTNPAAYARQAALVLIARNLVTRPLFDQLAAERPARAGEIWGVAALFGVAHPQAAALAALPEDYSRYADAHPELRAFVGRDDELALLQEVLLPRSGPVRAAVVCNLRGMAGVGKTYLVERFFMEHLERFPGGHLKLTLGAGEAPTGEALLRDLAERLDVALQGPAPLDLRVRAAAMALRPLLHLDNVDSEAQARGAAELVTRLPGVPIVLAGRYQFGRATPGWRLVPVEPFSVSDALAQLAAELVPEVAARVPEGTRRTLVGALGGLPLAIHLAASYLNAGYRVEDFLGELAESGLSLEPFTASDTAYRDRAERALRATFDLSLLAYRAELGVDADAGLSGVAALGVAPLVGVGRSWMEAIVGAPPGKVIRWMSLAVKLSIVQHDAAEDRWRVHKLLGEYLRSALRAASRAAEPPSALSTEAMKPLNAQAPGLWARVLAWLRSLFGRGDKSTPANAGLEAEAVARMDRWVLVRLPQAPEETVRERWGALRAEHEAVAEWVAGLDGARAVLGGWVGFDYALVSGPYAAWLGAVARGLHTTADPKARSDLLWCQGKLARQAGELDLTLQATAAKEAHDDAQGWEREVALAAGLRADVLQARGQLEEALRIRREEELPVFERLGDVRNKAVTMGKIAYVHEARGQFDEALRIRREEMLPIFERLGAVRHKAVTMGEIADVLQARGQLEEALRIRCEEELPVFERLGDVLNKAITMGKIADVLQARGQLDEALRIRRAEMLPVYEGLGDVRNNAMTMGKIAEVLQARGQLDEALRIQREEVLPVYERIGDVREKAVTMGKIADILQARGQLDEALRIRREDELPVYEQLGEVREKAATMGKIGDSYLASGQLDEALRVQREEVLPVYDQLGLVRERAVTMGKIADVLQEQGQLDEALRIRREEVVPAFERLGDQRELLVAQTNLAVNLLLTEKREHIPEAFTLLTTALACAVALNFPVEAEQLRNLFHELDLTPPY